MQKIGAYQIEEKELGSGQHSVVYKAWVPNSSRPVALKVLTHYTPEILEKFQAETQLTKSLNVSNVRRIYDIGRTPDGKIYVAMEYVDNSLKELVDWKKRRKQTFTPEKAVELLMPIAQVLDAVHQKGWVHLDVKPENILLYKEGRTVLGDFGIARRKGETTSDGTPRYMSPEQASGKHPVGPWSDIYSLGVILYEMLTGQPPFTADSQLVLVKQHLERKPASPRQFNRTISRDVANVVLKALEKEPPKRWRTATEMLAALREPPASEFSADLLRKPAVWGGAAAVGALLIGITIWFNRPVPEPTPSPTASSYGEVTATITTEPSPPITAEIMTSVPAPAPPTDTVPPGKPTSTPRPTSTPAPPTRTPTKQTRAPRTVTPESLYKAPKLISSRGGGKDTKSVSLRWSWDGQLADDEYFDVRIWEKGWHEHYGQARVKSLNFEFNVETRDRLGEEQGGTAHNYCWQVVVVRGKTSGPEVSKFSDEDCFVWNPGG